MKQNILSIIALVITITVANSAPAVTSSGYTFTKDPVDAWLDNDIEILQVGTRDHFAHNIKTNEVRNITQELVDICGGFYLLQFPQNSPDRTPTFCFQVDDDYTTLSIFRIDFSGSPISVQNQTSIEFGEKYGYASLSAIGYGMLAVCLEDQVRGQNHFRFLDINTYEEIATVVAPGGIGYSYLLKVMTPNGLIVSQRPIHNPDPVDFEVDFINISEEDFSGIYSSRDIDTHSIRGLTTLNKGQTVVFWSDSYIEVVGIDGSNHQIEQNEDKNSFVTYNDEYILGYTYLNLKLISIDQNTNKINQVSQLELPFERITPKTQVITVYAENNIKCAISDVIEVTLSVPKLQVIDSKNIFYDHLYQADRIDLPNGAWARFNEKGYVVLSENGDFKASIYESFSPILRDQDHVFALYIEEDQVTCNLLSVDLSTSEFKSSELEGCNEFEQLIYVDSDQNNVLYIDSSNNLNAIFQGGAPQKIYSQSLPANFVFTGDIDVDTQQAYFFLKVPYLNATQGGLVTAFTYSFERHLITNATVLAVYGNVERAGNGLYLVSNSIIGSTKVQLYNAANKTSISSWAYPNTNMTQIAPLGNGGLFVFSNTKGEIYYVDATNSEKTQIKYQNEDDSDYEMVLKAVNGQNEFAIYTSSQNYMFWKVYSNKEEHTDDDQDWEFDIWM